MWYKLTSPGVVMKNISYVFMFYFIITGFSIHAHPNCLLVLLRKIKGQSGYQPIGESTPIVSKSNRTQTSPLNDTDIPTLAQDPLAFARYYWGFELSFFDKK